MARRTTLLLAALALAGTEAAAATVTVTKVERVRPGWIRIDLEYVTRDTPTFRLTPVCRTTPRPEWLIASIVSVVPQRGEAAITVPDDLGWLADRRTACRVEGVAVEMLQGADVVARTEVPLALPGPDLVALPVSEPDPEPSRLKLVGRKFAAPQTRMTEAGVTWSLNDHLAFHLSYERTAFAPIMSKDHDDGILTGLKLGF